jgi:hypothetical protein
MNEPNNLSLVDSIRDLQRRKPFEPFRIVTVSGDKYLVEASDNLAIGESQIFYCYPHSDKLAYIRISQLVAIEQFRETSRI